MKTIRIYFTDFWRNFDKNDNLFIKILSKRFKVIIDKHDPEYLFFSCYSKEFLSYNCVRIFYTGENILPNFNLTDYAIGTARISFDDRYLRLPDYTIYKYSRGSYLDVYRKNLSNPTHLANRKFCCFVYSNATADPFREYFFNELSKYKRVDSGGRFMNNIGHNVENKIDFLKDYKFTIAFENSSFPGYSTEKIVDAMLANSLPIYWGNPEIGKEFNSDSFINFHDLGSVENTVKAIIELDINDHLYLNKLNEPWINSPLEDYSNPELILENFLRNIFEKSIDKGKKRNSYLWQAWENDELIKLIDDSKKLNNLKHSKIYSILKKLKVLQKLE